MKKKKSVVKSKVISKVKPKKIIKNKPKNYNFYLTMALIGLLIIIAFSVFQIIEKPALTGKAITIPAIPDGCSENEIKTMWSSVFNEGSSGVNVSANLTGGLCAFIAHKIKNSTELYYIQGVHSQSFTSIRAAYTNFTLNLSNYNVYFIINKTYSPVDISNISRRNITNEDYAQSEFIRYFNNSLSNGSWEQQTMNDIPAFGNTEVGVVENSLNSNLRNVFREYSLVDWWYAKINSSQCMPNWTVQASNCSADERKIFYYTDLNSCSNISGIPANYSLGCDLNGNGVIGNGSIKATIPLVPYINGTLLNNSLNYTNNSLLRVELKRDNVSLIWFDHNFSLTLNLSDIYIETQNSSYNFSYIIVENLSDKKSVSFDRLNTSNSAVCIRDTKVNSINDFSESCNSSSEFILNCPGNITSETKFYACEKTNTTYTVSGLTGSAVKEFINSENQPVCASNWSCASWAVCSSAGNQTRVCTDLNNCTSPTIAKPIESQTCMPPCTLNWTCTNFTPEICPKNQERTRVCTDLNKCGVTTGKPTEVESCVYETTPVWIWFSLGGLVIIAIIGVIVWMTISLTKKTPPEKPFEDDSDNHIDWPITPPENSKPTTQNLPAQIQSPASESPPTRAPLPSPMPAQDQTTNPPVPKPYIPRINRPNTEKPKKQDSQ
ncbi:hypothetical protein KA107_00735 [Candidatus Pacearchaeota archaeon]|nr:hypothetical protein [Candidatus Pacearchaeota archaeon]